MAANEELRRLLPPPAGRVRVAVDWGSVEASVGVVLPDDYKIFIEEYGVGSIDGFLWAHHPATGNRHVHLQTQISEQLAVLRALRVERIPYALFPDPGGLLPWGTTDNGDVCYWRTQPRDAATLWTVVVNESRGPKWDEFPATMTEFLVAVLSGRYRCPVFPDDFPSPHPTFEPQSGDAPKGGRGVPDLAAALAARRRVVGTP